MNTEKKLIILGIDPGTRIAGYGIIQSTIQLIDYGCVRPPAHLKLEQRYLILYESVLALIEKYRPDVVAVENQFVNKNIQSAMKLGMAKACVMLAAAKCHLPIFEYAPRKAKQSVVGNGNASKEQVQKMVKILLNMAEIPQPQDASDALAIAICHAYNYKHQALLSELKNV